MSPLDPRFRPSKKLGQNFLTNDQIVERIAKAGLVGDYPTKKVRAEPKVIVEIGPGKGVLTKQLLKQTTLPVIAIEKDKRLFEYLTDVFALEIAIKRLTLINDDALSWQPPAVPYSIIANIPYSITSPLIDHFIRDEALTTKRMPLYAVLLVQKEVAEKMCAQAPDMHVLALHVQTFGETKYLFKVTAGNFSPVPKVDSAVVEIDCTQTAARADATQNKDFYAHYFELIHKAFSQKRKMLSSTIGRDLCEKAGIDPMRRPQTLSIQEWHSLASMQ